MYIPEDKNRIFTDEEVEFIMSPILKEEDSKLLEDEKGYKTVKRGPIGRAIKNFWTFFGIFSYLLIAGLITAFFVWCYWVRKKAHEKRRKMENEWTVDSEGAYETIASEDEDSDESELTGIWGEDEPDIEGGIGNPVNVADTFGGIFAGGRDDGDDAGGKDDDDNGDGEDFGGGGGAVGIGRGRGKSKKRKKKEKKTRKQKKKKKQKKDKKKRKSKKKKKGKNKKKRKKQKKGNKSKKRKGGGKSKRRR